MDNLHKFRLITSWIGFIVFLIGAILLGSHDLGIFIGVFLMMTGNNVGMMLKYDLRFSDTQLQGLTEILVAAWRAQKNSRVDKSE